MQLILVVVVFVTILGGSYTVASTDPRNQQHSKIYLCLDGVISSRVISFLGTIGKQTIDIKAAVVDGALTMH